jgi:hypothetical protein
MPVRFRQPDAVGSDRPGPQFLRSVPDKAPFVLSARGVRKLTPAKQYPLVSPADRRRTWPGGAGGVAGLDLRAPSDSGRR